MSLLTEAWFLHISMGIICRHIDRHANTLGKFTQEITEIPLRVKKICKTH